MKIVFIIGVFFTALNCVAETTICSLTCGGTSENILNSAKFPDVQAFHRDCKARGGDGVVLEAGALFLCLKYIKFASTETGQGATQYEAEVSAKQHCYKYNCSNAGISGPTCPSGIYTRSGSVQSTPVCK